MRLLTIVALLLAFPAAHAQLAVEFSSPAQFGPTASQGNLTWALIVLEPDSRASFDLSALQVTFGANHTYLRAKTSLLGVGQSNAPSLDSRPTEWEGPMQVALAASAQWSSIWIQGTGIRVDVGDADGRLVAPSTDLPLVATDVGIPPGEYRPRETPDTRLESVARGSLTFTVQGTVTEIEWHNMTASCSSTPCPDGAQSTTVSATPSFIATSHFAEWQLQGTLVGAGTALAITTGGPRPDLLSNGSLRMPKAACQGCELDLEGTLISSGVAGLTGIEPATGDRLRANMDASQSTLFADEQAIPPSAWAVPAIGAAAAISAFVVWKVGAAFLFSRLADPLGSSARRRIMDHVLANPGVTFRELQRGLQIGNGTATYHLAILSRAGMIAEFQDGNRKRLYENHGRYSSSWRKVALLRDENTRRILDWIRVHPQVSQSEIISWGQESGWKRTALQERLRRLEQTGLLAVRQSGRCRSYEANVPPNLAAVSARSDSAGEHVGQA